MNRPVPKPDLIPARRRPGDRVVVAGAGRRCWFADLAGTVDAVMPDGDKDRVARPEAMYWVALGTGPHAGRRVPCWESELADGPAI